MSATTFTPPQLAARWKCKPETVRTLIETGVLRGFSLSPPGTRRPRWRIGLDVVIAYESGERQRPQQAPKNRKGRRRAECPAGPF